MRLTALPDRFRRPEYTGENRCIPCTVVNAGFAVVGAALVAALATPLAGVVVLVLAGVTIYLRGYLVPGTPELTARYFPPWLLRLFGKEAVETTATATDGEDATDADDPLVAGGVLASTADPQLSESFDRTWRGRTGELLDAEITPERVARAFGAEGASAMGDTSFVLDGNRSVRWGSRAALAADLAGAELLAERVPGWAEFDHERRRRTLRGLRLSLSNCPACGAELTPEVERVDPCCQKPHLVAESVCDACDTAVGDAAVVDTGDVESVPAALLGG